ncbi:MAG: prepilin-type N-terminal cleavage/methylation domain-containing protein [Bacilli bacterium]|nr:MAG: prepilin-type N-terminal cleavage/methylation domain-containing protein [Bacilli bacterium]
MNKDVIKRHKERYQKKRRRKKDIKKKLKIFEKNKWGFTLIELLGVIVIIGLVIGGSIFLV